MPLSWLPARREPRGLPRMSSALVLATLGEMLTEAEAMRSLAADAEVKAAEARVAALRDARDRLGELAAAAAEDEAAERARRR